MGLSIHVEGCDESFDFDVGAYSLFSRFRLHLILVIRGVYAMKAYEEKQRRASFQMLFGKDKGMMDVFDKMTAKSTAASSSTKKKSKQKSATRPAPPSTFTALEPELELFLNHSDCSGEFNHDECTKLKRLFQNYKARFANSMAEAGFVGIYNNFLKAFTMVANNPEAKIVFC